jgi:hypothetical protein
LLSKTGQKRNLMGRVNQRQLSHHRGKKISLSVLGVLRFAFGNLKPHFKFSREEISDKILTVVSRLGLSETEACNFVTYWVSSWQKHSYWLVHILNEEVINKLFPLRITPIPKEVKRIYLLFGAGKESDCVTE